VAVIGGRAAVGKAIAFALGEVLGVAESTHIRCGSLPKAEKNRGGCCAPSGENLPSRTVSRTRFAGACRPLSTETPVGMLPNQDSSPVPDSLLHAGPAVGSRDAVYSPLWTPLFESGKGPAAARIMTRTRKLAIYQGRRRCFELFTGLTPLDRSRWEKCI